MHHNNRHACTIVITTWKGCFICNVSIEFSLQLRHTQIVSQRQLRQRPYVARVCVCACLHVSSDYVKYSDSCIAVEIIMFTMSSADTYQVHMHIFPSIYLHIYTYTCCCKHLCFPTDQNRVGGGVYLGGSSSHIENDTGFKCNLWASKKQQKRLGTK